MGKNKKLIMKTITAIAVSGVFFTSLSVAQSLGTQSTTTDQTNLPSLTVFQADSQTLLNAGCDPQVMNNLNQTYLSKRGMQRDVELRTLVREQVDNTPKPPKSGSGGSCYQQAADNINSIMSTAKNILALLSGSPDLSGAMQQASKAAMNMACQEVANYTSGVTGVATQAVNGQVNGALGQLNNYQIGSGALGTNGGQVLSSVGLNTNGVTANNNVPYVTSGQIAGVATQAQSGVSGWATQVLGCNSVATCSPFK